MPGPIGWRERLGQPSKRHITARGAGSTPLQPVGEIVDLLLCPDRMDSVLEDRHAGRRLGRRRRQTDAANGEAQSS